MTFEQIFESLDNETDLDILNAARNRVAYGKSQNSLVQWTMSDAWMEPRLLWYLGNGAVFRSNGCKHFPTEWHGEFEAK